MPVCLFQFTHPVWGATAVTSSALTAWASFNSRTPCGVRHDLWQFWDVRKQFQFTHPVWGATYDCAVWGTRIRSFNSRTPCGVRL